ncbi:hypothetical protein [Paenibacillus hunanensis]|uniref:Uncharacterized protein n=1 Tax=Paenibacillus hunanensis TaxID=539262 RepID=A0ABU1J218_9BACL|nr:hypothetical protein [Paenibacillus hunanensis]MDR6245545.1 hypothetical protein [Paenibacillus hunanensis]GGJ09700.1 hypothetical protein GCM10008022_18570 [Paenibacillus hunanensis]
MRLPTRDEAMQEFLEQHVLSGWLDDVPLIENNCTQHEQRLIDTLMSALEQSCNEASRLQATGEKGPVRHIYISLLRTSLLDNRAQYRIDCHDQRWFLDDTDSTAYWDAGLIFDPLFQRMQQLKEQRKAYGRRITVMDIEKIMQLEAIKYHTLTMHIVQALLPYWLEHPTWLALNKTPDCSIYAGEFHDECELLHQEGVEQSEVSQLD